MFRFPLFVFPDFGKFLELFLGSKFKNASSASAMALETAMALEAPWVSKASCRRGLHDSEASMTSGVDARDQGVGRFYFGNEFWRHDFFAVFVPSQNRRVIHLALHCFMTNLRWQPYFLMSIHNDAHA